MKLKGTGGCHSNGDIHVGEFGFAGIVAFLAGIIGFAVGVLVGASLIK